jgi:16S rRNA (adenine1518-N6/adenine1519-N6)-dimethyltransferase
VSDARRPDLKVGSATAAKSRPRKRFGQHFLEAAWVAKLIASLEAAPTDTFLEIGPGRGALTKPLMARVKRLIAVEIDRDLAAALRESEDARGSKDRRLRVIEGDFLEVGFDEILAGESLPVRVVGNLPYNVSSPILFRLLAAHDGGHRFSDATLMLQREVADRWVARPGTRA